MNKIKFTIKRDGQDIELAVVNPTSEQRTYSKIEYNKAVRKALEAGQLLRAKLDDYIEKQNLWDKEAQEKDEELVNKLEGLVKKLNAGGIKKSEGRDLAIQIKLTRNELIRHRMVKTQLDNITVEAFGEQAQFDYLVSVCTVYNDSGEVYFKSLDEYRSSDHGFEAANYLSNLLYNIQALEESLPENKFLKRFSFVNDQFELVNEKGELIDLDGKVIVKEEKVELEPVYLD